jgi:hypothetical protein
MRKFLLLLSVNLVGVAIGAVGVSYVAAQDKPPSVTRTELLRKSISGIEGKEGVMFVADVPPGAVAGRHFHPGDELIYVLQGTMVFEPHGEQPFQLRQVKPPITRPSTSIMPGMQARLNPQRF